MKTSSYSVQIPEPCHESWSTMQPDDKGRFCNACNKTVIDFTGKTDAQVHAVLMANKDQKVCGHFKTSQVHRPLHISVDLSRLPVNISGTRAFAIALVLAFGTFLFSCTGYDGKKIEGIKVTGHSDNYTTGTAIQPVENKIKDTLTISNPVKSISEPETYIEGEVEYRQSEDTVKKDLIMRHTGITDLHYSIMGGVSYTPVEPEDTTMRFIQDSSFMAGPEISVQPGACTQGIDLHVYPNPGEGEFTISYNVIKQSNIRVDIFNLAGSWLKTIVNTEDQHTGRYQVPVSLRSLPVGIYIVNMINDGRRFTERLVIER